MKALLAQYAVTYCILVHTSSGDKSKKITEASTGIENSCDLDDESGHSDDPENADTTIQNLLKREQISTEVIMWSDKSTFNEKAKIGYATELMRICYTDNYNDPEALLEKLVDNPNSLQASIVLLNSLRVWGRESAQATYQITLGSIGDYLEYDRNVSELLQLFPSQTTQVSFPHESKYTEKSGKSKSSKMNNCRCLLDVLLCTRTPMGSRLLRNWLLHPLQKLDEIMDRQNCISMLVSNPQQLSVLTDHVDNLKRFPDLEKIGN